MRSSDDSLNFTTPLYGFFSGKATEIIRNVKSFAMKLLKSEKIVLIITAVFIALTLGLTLGQTRSDAQVVFAETSFKGRGEEALSARQEDGMVYVININTASVEQLDTLKGIGPVLAERIVEYRETKGPFKTIEDITKVRGIGAGVYNDIAGNISVE